jgi:hypothetical protein
VLHSWDDDDASSPVFYAALHYMLSLSFDFNIHMEHKCCSTASIIMSAVKMKAKLPQGNCSRRIEFDSFSLSLSTRDERLVGASFARAERVADPSGFGNC